MTMGRVYVDPNDWVICAKCGSKETDTCTSSSNSEKEPVLEHKDNYKQASKKAVYLT